MFERKRSIKNKYIINNNFDQIIHTMISLETNNLAWE